jgi:hypothetical protein
MGTVDDQTDQRAAWRSRLHRMRLECRECDVICERVVYPWHCLKSNCEYVYAYEDSETMYFGCLCKVYSAEFDLAFFSDGLYPAGQDEAAQESDKASGTGGLARRGRDRRPAIRRSDPYGPVRITRPPRPQCHTKIEQAYDSYCAGGDCCNPTFFHQHFGAGGDNIKMTTTPSGDAADPRT